MLPSVVQNFVKPQPQKALNGQEGLTSVEIAKALGAEHRDVKDSIRRISEEDQAFWVQTAKVQTGGRPVEMFILNVQDSKMVVATYQNAIGRAYLRFLLACERIALEIVPALQAEIADLKQKLAVKSLPQPKVSTIDVAEEVDGLWGKTIGPRRRKVRADAVPKLTLLTYKAHHIGRVVEGCGKSQQKTATEIQEVVHTSAIKASEELFPLLGKA
jgi:hypothetical protein